MIGLGVGIDYALFVAARYREHRAAGQDNPTALSDAMGSAGSAVLLAGGTVVVAMAALNDFGLGFLASIEAQHLAGRALRRGHRPHAPAGAAVAARQPHRRRAG